MSRLDGLNFHPGKLGSCNHHLSFLLHSNWNFLLVIANVLPSNEKLILFTEVYDLYFHSLSYFPLMQKSWRSCLVMAVKTTCDVVPQKQADIPKFSLNYWLCQVSIIEDSEDDSKYSFSHRFPSFMYLHRTLFTKSQISYSEENKLLTLR